MGLDAVLQLIGGAVVASRPVIRERSENRGHGMVHMAGDAAFGTKSQHNVGTEFSNLQGEILNDLVGILTMKLPVRIVENNAAAHAQNLARSSEFFAPHGSQFVIAPGAAAI